MRNRIWLLACALSILGTPSRSAPLSLEDTANEMSAEAAQCAAFYTLGMTCFGDKLDAASKKGFEDGRSMSNSLVYMGGKKAGMSDKALFARNELAMNQLMDEMDRSCVNISVMLNKYAKLCPFLVQHPDERIKQIQANGPRP